VGSCLERLLVGAAASMVCGASKEIFKGTASPLAITYMTRQHEVIKPDI